MPLVAQCPFFMRERNGYTYCESCRFEFKDKTMRRRFLESYCANDDYSACPICRETNAYYDRKESGIRDEIEAEAII